MVITQNCELQASQKSHLEFAQPDDRPTRTYMYVVWLIDHIPDV